MNKIKNKTKTIVIKINMCNENQTRWTYIDSILTMHPFERMHFLAILYCAVVCNTYYVCMYICIGYKQTNTHT